MSAAITNTELAQLKIKANAVLETTARRPRRYKRSASSTYNVEHVQAELSQNSDFAMALNLDPDVSHWTSNPSAVAGRAGSDRIVQHIPDYMVWYRDGSIAAIDADGIAGFTPVDASIRYIDACCELPLDSTARRNLRAIRSQLNLIVSRNDQSRVLDLLANGEPCTVIEAAASLTGSTNPLAAVLAMVAAQLIQIDWRSAPITCSTRVWSRNGCGTV